tara:strand:+ start:26 stop:655 length:630 start_codon:yes stop_codon:yes gene_type:complete
MAITINGSGTITGISEGGLNDDSIAIADLSATGTASASTYLCGNNTWATPAGGITDADQWRITADFTGSADPVTSNWERTDYTGFAKIGDGMNESSGVFTFPATGIWLINAQMLARKTSDASYLLLYIHWANDGTNYNNICHGVGSIGEVPSNTWYGSAQCDAIVNVTAKHGDTNAQKVRVNMSSDGAIVNGNSGLQTSGLTFIRLGDA